MYLYSKRFNILLFLWKQIMYFRITVLLCTSTNIFVEILYLFFKNIVINEDVDQSIAN